MKNFHPTGNCPVRDQPAGRQMVDACPDYFERERHDAFQRHSQDHRRYFTADADRHAPDFGGRRPGAPQSIPRSAAPRGILPHGTGHNSDATYRSPCKLGGRKHGRDTDEPADCRAVNRRKDGVTA